MKQIAHFFKAFFVVIFVFVLFPIARLCCIKKRIWLISERRNEARDNGLVFYKYLTENQKHINCFYAIDFDCKDYEIIKNIGGKTVKFGSFKHFWYFCGAKFLISTTTQGYFPNYYLDLFKRKVGLFGKYIYLKHGIIKDDLVFLYKKTAKLNMLFCGSKPEYNFILNNFGYNNLEVKYTGLARFDEYQNLKLKNEILIMPTWRRGLSENNIQSSDYFASWTAFLQSKEFNDLLVKNNIVAKFYLHPLFQKYTSKINTNCSNITIVSCENSNLRNLIKEAKMLITDYSSVFFDFAYMKKPIIFYQFDEENFFLKHYQKGYFNYRKDGFGLVVSNYEELINEIIKIFNNSFKLENKYVNNINRFFTIFDSNNCFRIYKEIVDTYGE